MIHSFFVTEIRLSVIFCSSAISRVREVGEGRRQTTTLSPHVPHGWQHPLLLCVQKLLRGFGLLFIPGCGFSVIPPAALPRNNDPKQFPAERARCVFPCTPLPAYRVWHSRGSGRATRAPCLLPAPGIQLPAPGIPLRAHPSCSPPCRAAGAAAGRSPWRPARRSG